MVEYDYLYGLTVQGIQSYIFSTNKLKEIIGASEIIEQLCTTWFDEFIKKNDIKGKKYLNAAGNIRFNTSKKSAELIFKEYHEFLLKNAPGVPFSQAVIELKDGLSSQDAIIQLDDKLRAQRNKPLFEHDLGFMVRAKARRTGNATFKFVKKEEEYLDTVTSAKFDNKETIALTTKTLLDGFIIKYPLDFKTIAKKNQHHWLALVHIDGNGMGDLIQKIIKDTTKNTFETLKEFSYKVNTSTLEAFKTAIKEVVLSEGEDKTENSESYKLLPMRPIILGGDDVTIIIRADLALKFTEVFLTEFEKNTKEKLKENGLMACAGIAFVKEKFPFHYSAHLAEELCSYAKDECKREASCLQFHRVQDAFIDNYSEIIKRELTTTGTKPFVFQNGPYYLDEKDGVTIKSLTDNLKLLKKDDAPKNGIREWIDTKFNNPLMADTLMKRLKAKSGKAYQTILDNQKAFMDYHTLLSINTKI